MSETSNSSFNHDNHINHVIAPEKPTTSGGTPSPEDKNKSKFPLKYRILSAVAGVALVGGGAGIWAATAGEAPAKAPTHNSAPKHPTKPSQEATPSATPTTDPETATGPDTYTYGVTEADVDGLLHESTPQLSSEPILVRENVAMYYAQTLPAFAKSYQEISQNPSDVLPDTVNKDNTPEQIVAFIMSQYRQAATLTQADQFHFDKTGANNYLVSQLMGGSSSPSYDAMSKFVNQFDGPNAAPSARSLAASDYLSFPTINSSSAKYVDGVGNTCIDLDMTQQLNGNGGSVPEKVTACLVTNEHGSIWMLK